MSIDDVLGRPVSEAVRRQALALLDSVRAARVRLDDAADVEAIHDFRVALRRLRSLLKAHRSRLGRKIEKLRRRLGAIADLTTDARDAEVQLAWLAAEKLGPARRAAVVRLTARLEERKQRGHETARRQAATELDGRVAAAERRLARFERDLREDDEPTLGTELARLLVEHAEGLAGRLADVGASTDEATAHEARILGKQLRYLLEPLVESSAVGGAAKSAVKDLKALQDVLGELHDAHVMGHVVEEALVDAASERARSLGAAVLGGRKETPARDLRPGMVAVAERVRDRRDRLFRALIERRAAVSGLVGEVTLLAGRIATPSDVEIERKYLLRAMPDVDGAELVDIEQGWIPGERLKERFRRMRGPDGVWQLIRGMKLGTGIRRTEVEEPCPPELFEKLWPLTAGRRITKKRYRIADGDLVWEIDQFADRDLVLAEIELPSETTQVTPPPWIAGLIVREVTGEKAFTNEALASVPAPPKGAARARDRKTRPRRNPKADRGRKTRQ